MARTATHCSTLEHTAAHFNTLQHTATRCNTLKLNESCIATKGAVAHCNSLHYTTTHGNLKSPVYPTKELQHTKTHSNTQQHTATHSNKQQHTATHATSATKIVLYINRMSCKALQHTATHCNWKSPVYPPKNCPPKELFSTERALSGYNGLFQWSFWMFIERVLYRLVHWKYRWEILNVRWKNPSHARTVEISLGDFECSLKESFIPNTDSFSENIVHIQG